METTESERHPSYCPIHGREDCDGCEAEREAAAEFWYCVSKAAVAFVIENFGAKAAGQMVEAVHEQACCDFVPSATVTAGLSDRAAIELIEGWRGLSGTWVKKQVEGGNG